MKMRRVLATAVAAAVTTPVVFLAVAPAFADGKPAGAAARQDEKQTIGALREAVAAAQKVFDEAGAAREAGERQLDADLDKLSVSQGGTHPLVIAYGEARKAADAAAAAKKEADGKLAAAEKALAELPAEATQEQKDAAHKAVDDARKAAGEAATAKTAADTKASEAGKALSDERVRLVQVFWKDYQKPHEDAQKALDAAKKALADALTEATAANCTDGTKNPDLVSSLTGPKKIAAGGSGVFTFRVTNQGTARLEEVAVDALVFGMERIEQDHKNFTVTSSSPADTSLAPGKSIDFKLKVAIGAAAKADTGVLPVVARYVDKGVSCGIAEKGHQVTFTVTKPQKPGKPGKPGSGSTGGSTGGNGNTTQQGGQSNTPVTNGTSGSTGGTLAKTGAGSSTMPIALAGAAAVALGAGAMVVVRRRKAGADA
ncbi:LPXTG cell wall anchor domain-containing protein [Streptomyces sp. NPDC058084]|uniref:LPXTG cell wall anchor domain-containing protein n=1 Tax=Streptomyces sp. NPDC058084 TaxID=3346333 RepID=UPI0036ED393C